MERVTFGYEWIRSKDDTDGPFSFPEKQDDLKAEWARSSGVAPHNVTLGGYFKLPASIFLTATDTWHGSAPFNITLAQDLANNGPFNNRGGAPRNSGNGPSFNSLSTYASKRAPLPKGFRTHWALRHNRLAWG